MVLATHWFWNLSFLGFIYGLLLPIDPFWFTCACWKCCFAIAKQRINLKTCIWPRRNACFEKLCFPLNKTAYFLKWSVSPRRNTLFQHRICQQSRHHRLPFSYIYIYIYIYVYVYIHMWYTRLPIIIVGGLIRGKPLTFWIVTTWTSLWTDFGRATHAWSLPSPPWSPPRSSCGRWRPSAASPAPQATPTYNNII